MISTKKIISLFTTNRADYYLQRNLISKLNNESSIKFHLVATGNHLSSNQGNTIDEIVKNNPNLFKLDIGSDKTDQESINQNIIKINASVFKYLNENKPDAAILLGDRYEMCVLAQCLYSNRVPIVHLHGGELTLGSLDDGYRHAISKFSMLHFVANETYKDRLIKMGENPDSIHISGAMVIDNILNLKKMTWDEIQKKVGPISSKFILVSIHPNSISPELNLTNLKILFDSLSSLKDFSIILSSSNPDILGNEFNDELIKISQEHKNIFFQPNMGADLYLNLMMRCNFLIGNSSSGIIEAPLLNCPSITIGSRQAGRIQDTQSPLIITSEFTRESIESSIKKALSLPSNKKQLSEMDSPSNLIMQILKDMNFSIRFKKSFYEK